MRQSGPYTKTAFSFFFILCVLACGKDNPNKPSEEKLRIAVDAAPFVVLPGPEFDFSLIVESTMPAGGVNIEFRVDGEKDGNNYYNSPPAKTQAARTALKVQYVPRQVMCVCTVKVVSAGDAGNTATTSFRLVYK